MRTIRRIGLRAVVLAAMLGAPLAGIFAGPASAATPTWTVATLPVPSGSTSPLTLISVSCPSATSCVAVGGTGSSVATETLASGKWSVATLPLPSGATSPALISVSCPSTSDCVAVGHDTSGGTTVPLAYTLSGGTWQVDTESMPPGATSAYLTGVSCVTSTQCYAVGTASTGPIDAIPDGPTSWATGSLPVPSGATSPYLTGVSCSSSTSCVAVGFATSGSTSVPMVDTLSSGTWTAATLPVPSGQTYATLFRVSCTSSTSCVAVGYDNSGVLVETLAAGTWAATATSLSLNTMSNVGISCTSSTSCVAVGQSSSSGAPTAYTLSGGTTWSAATLPLPSGQSSASLSGVSCTSSTSCLAVGNTSASPIAETFGVPTATVTVAASPSTIVWSYSSSNTITFTATVAASVAPTGTVTFTSNYPGGSATLCSAVTLSSGKATCTAPADKILPSDPSSATTVTVIAAYSGDSTYGASSGTASVTVDTSAVTTTLPVTASPNPVTWTSSSTNTVAITATVTASSGSGTPTGTVTFTTGSTTLCSAVALASGSATCTVPVDKILPTKPTSAQTITVTAAYSGNSAYAAMSNWVTLTVGPPTTTVTASPSTVVWSGSSTNTVAFDATVSVSSGSTTPTGTVTFAVGSTTLCSAVALSSGSATCTAPVDKLVTTKPSSATTANITASYSGNSTYGASSGTASVTVDPPTTYVEMSAPSGVITWSSSSTNTVSVTATVKASYGSGVPTGTVTFTTGSTTLCSAVALASGSATCTVPVDKILPTEPTSATMVNIAAAYSGSSSYAASSGKVTVDIGVFSPTSATTTVTASPSTATWSTSSSNTVTFTATVAATSGSTVPSGTVTFTAGSTTLCSAVALASGSATCTVPVDSLITYTPTVTTDVAITAVYSNEAASGVSSGTALVTLYPPSSAKEVLSYGASVTGWMTGALDTGASNDTPIAAPYGEANTVDHAPPFAPDLLGNYVVGAYGDGGNSTCCQVNVTSSGSTAGVKTSVQQLTSTPILAWIGNPGYIAQIGTASESAAGVFLSTGPASWSPSGATSTTASWTGGTSIIDLAQGLGTLTVGSWATWESMFGTSEPAGITSSSSIAALLGAEGYSTDIMLLAPKATVITTTQSGPGAAIVETAQVPAYEIEMFPLASGGSPLATITYPPATVTYTQSATAITNPQPEPTVTVSGTPSLTTDYPAGSVTTTQFGTSGSPYFLAGGLLSVSQPAAVQPFDTTPGNVAWGYAALPDLVRGLDGANAQDCGGLCLQTPETFFGAGFEGVPGLQVATGNNQSTAVGQAFGHPLVALVMSGTQSDVGAIVAFHIVPGASGASATFANPSSDPVTANGAASNATTWYADSGTTGDAASGALIGNGIPGTFSVVATLLGGGTAAQIKTLPVTFNLSLTAAPTVVAPPPPPPPPTCPSGDTGSYPNCVAPHCPSGDTGTYPDCHAPVCPSGDTGTYPNCVAPVCPAGDTGTWPDCIAPVVLKMSGFVAEKVPPNTVFPHRLHATVTRNGQPVAGYAVTFHLSAASGLTFDGPPVLSVAVLTNSQGVATSPPIRSGSTVGTFVATATGAGAVGTTSGTVGSLGVVPVVIPPVTGYRLVAGDGGVFDFGSAKFYGSAANIGPDSGNVVGLANDGTGGYWLATSNGGVVPVGGAPRIGSLACHGCTYHPAAPVVGIASTPNGGGYWLVAADGGVFAFGNAQFYGSMGGKHLAAPVVGMAATPHGHGYWLVASDGGVFAFGSAKFYGSMGGKPLNKPVVGIASTPGGHGYWLVASDGGIFAFGSAQFRGSMGGKALDKPVVGMAVDPATGGYWLVAADGGIFAFDAPFYGSRGGEPLNKPVVGMVVAS